MAKDVRAALGYSNSSMAVQRHISPEDKATVAVGLRGSPPAIINESGLYALIFGSQQANAKDFQKWVTGTVLPSIRKNGGYLTPEVAVLAVESPTVFMAR